MTSNKTYTIPYNTLGNKQHTKQATKTTTSNNNLPAKRYTPATHNNNPSSNLCNNSDTPSYVTIALFCNNSYLGYRTVTAGFLNRLVVSLKSGLLKHADIEFVIVERKEMAL